MQQLLDNPTANIPPQRLSSPNTKAHLFELRQMSARGLLCGEFARGVGVLGGAAL